MSPTLPQKPDVRTTADVGVIVQSFYGDIKCDPVLGRFFGDVAWEMHLPKMTAFWSSVLFHTGKYRGRPFDPHMQLQGLERTHFKHWLTRFRSAVAEHFEGKAAERMKLKGEQIASVFQVKLGLWETANGSPPAS